MSHEPWSIWSHSAENRTIIRILFYLLNKRLQIDYQSLVWRILRRHAIWLVKLYRKWWKIMLWENNNVRGICNRSRLYSRLWFKTSFLQWHTDCIQKTYIRSHRKWHPHKGYELRLANVVRNTFRNPIYVVWLQSVFHFGNDDYGRIIMFVHRAHTPRPNLIFHLPESYHLFIGNTNNHRNLILSYSMLFVIIPEDKDEALYQPVWVASFPLNPE